ncbi:MAG: hypothetical protein E6G17_09465 [Actinobacteria bacterium]|nr:MAG: hypothetical protein E6G17_09465 [Actinomycetota bacterium]
MEPFDTLLRVQERDTAIDQLRHRRDALPERTSLAAVEAERTAVESQLVDVTARRDEVARAQSRLEDEVESMDSKAGEVERKLYSGSVSAPRELQAMQADVESIKRHKSAVEDQLLELMERREPLDAEVARLEAERARLDAAAAELVGAIVEAEVTIDVELEDEQREREQLVAAAPDDLVALYEELRVKLGGVGVAALVGDRCGGCHLKLPATELARIKREPPDDVLRCDQCGRILVR